MQYLRRNPDVYTLRVTFGTAPQRLPGGPGGQVAGQGHTRGLPLRPWSAVAELDWNATDDPQASLRKLNNLTAAVRAEKPKARGGNLGCALSSHAQPPSGHVPAAGPPVCAASHSTSALRVTWTHNRMRRRSAWT